MDTSRLRCDGAAAHDSASEAHRPLLQSVELCVAAAVSQQLIMRPRFDDAPAIENEDAIGHADGREAVRDDDRRAAVRQPANTRASVLLTCSLRLAAFPRMPETRAFIGARGGGDRERWTPRARPTRTIASSPFQGRFHLLRHDPVGVSSRRSVVHTPRSRETGRRPRAAQFAPWAVYIPGAGTT